VVSDSAGQQVCFRLAFEFAIPDNAATEKGTIMASYKVREIQTEQLSDGKWIVCAKDNNGVMVVTRPG
jgi:hypothetical protein